MTCNVFGGTLNLNQSISCNDCKQMKAPTFQPHGLGCEYPYTFLKAEEAEAG